MSLYNKLCWFNRFRADKILCPFTVSAVLIFSPVPVTPDLMTLTIEMSDHSFGSSLHIPE